MIKRDRLSSALRMDDRSVNRALIGLMLALLLLAPASAQDTSQNSAAQSPDQLFVDAVTLYHQVSAKNEEEATSDLMEVARLFQRIQTDFPESAPAYLIAAGGFPGGVDLSRLPEFPSDAVKSTSTAVAPQSDPLDLSDLGMMMAFLQSHYPETLASLQIDPSAITQDAVGALQLRIAYMIAVFVSNGTEAAGEEIIDPSEYMSVLNAMAEDSGLLDSTTVFSEQLIADITEKKLQEVAASVFADIVMSGPWPEMSPEFQNMLRAGVDAAFKEGWDLMKAQQDPSVAVSMVFGRVKDARDIMVATNALNRTQESGLIQTALSMQTAAWLFVAYPDSPNTQKAVKGALYDMQSGVADIVGEDDAPAVTRIFNVGFGALRAAYRGETKRAEKLVGDIQEMGAESNIPALNVADNLLVIANLGQDAPARAANIMLGVTDLANIHEENLAAAARRSPVMDVSSTQTIPSVWGPEIVVPTNHSVWNRRYDRREDQRSVLVDLGVTNRAIDFSERYDPEYIGEAFAAEFIELGNVDLVHMRIGHVAATSDRFRPSVIVNGSTGVVPVTGPPFKISGTFLDNASQKLAGRIPNLIGTSSGVMHRLLPGGGQRFIELTMLSDGCRDCKAVGTSVRFIDYDETGQFVRTTNVGLVDHSVGFLFNAQNSVSEDPSGWRHMDFAQNAKALQYRLNMLGYNAGEMDGIPGPQTRQALMEFQAENCLEITAQPSSETVRALQSADGLSATCANAVVPEVISANSPLVPGTYVSDTKWCDRDSIPYDLVFEVQRLVRPSFILFGIEDGFEITRSDIVKGITQLKGNYHVGNAVDPGKFLIDVLSPETYREPLVGTASGGKTYSRCPNDSVLVTFSTGISSAPNSSQTAPEQSIIPSSTGRPFEPPRGSELRKIILDAARPDAEALYGPDVEFLVGTLRVIDETAYLAATAQRPGGIPINVTDTPAFREGLVDLNLGNPTGFEAILQHEAGVWHVRQSVGQVTEAWWLENCLDWAPLFPETCGLDVQVSMQKEQRQPDATIEEAYEVTADYLNLSQPSLRRNDPRFLSGDADLDSYLSSVLPDWLVPIEVRSKRFGSTSQGRISVAGELSVQVDLLKKHHNAEVVISTLERTGLSKGVLDAIIERNLTPKYGPPLLKEFRVVVPAGTKLPFNGELSYLDTVDGLRISGSIVFEDSGAIPADSVVDEWAYIPGSHSMFRVAHELHRMAWSLQEAAEQVAQDFFNRYGRSGVTISQGPNEYFRVLPFAYEADYGRILSYGPMSTKMLHNGLVLSFNTPAKPLISGDFSGRTFTSGQTTNLVMSLGIDPSDLSLTGTTLGVGYINSDGRQVGITSLAFLDPNTGNYSKLALSWSPWVIGVR